VNVSYIFSPIGHQLRHNYQWSHFK